MTLKKRKTKRKEKPDPKNKKRSAYITDKKIDYHRCTAKRDQKSRSNVSILTFHARTETCFLIERDNKNQSDRIYIFCCKKKRSAIGSMGGWLKTTFYSRKENLQRWYRGECKQSSVIDCHSIVFWQVRATLHGVALADGRCPSWNTERPLRTTKNNANLTDAGAQSGCGSAGTKTSCELLRLDCACVYHFALRSEFAATLLYRAEPSRMLPRAVEGEERDCWWPKFRLIGRF